jgi:hypothetical protein
MAVRAKHVFRWDLDKTYLRTEFDTLRDLWNAAWESATDKKAYPGAAALLRSLRRSPLHRICIISGSPVQMRSVLSAKLALDGIEFDEFVLKDNLRNALRLRFRALRSQVPYKLPALLESRMGILGHPPETLFGDDAEADAIVYCLYADILAGHVEEAVLRRCLEAARAYPDELERALALYQQIPRDRDTVQRVLIHLDRRSPTARFAHFGRRLVPIFNYLQAALLLYQDRVLDHQQVLFVADDMLASDEFEIDTLANSLQDLLRRGRLAAETVEKLCLELSRAASGSANTERAEEVEGIAWAFAESRRQLGGAPPLEWPEDNARLDYVELIDAEYKRRRSDYK